MLKSKITTRYEVHGKKRICQGDILRDLQFFIIDKNDAQLKLYFTYAIVVSQDCDLERSFEKKSAKSNPEGITEFSQYLPNIIILPAFPAEDVRSGDYLRDIFSIKPAYLNSGLWNPIKLNNSPRYHFLVGNLKLQIPDLVTDFKIHYALPIDYFKQKYNQSYLATVNELFREDLSQRFFSYLNRIGLPEIV